MSWAMVAVAAVGLVSAGMSYSQGQQQLKAQTNAANQAREDAQKAEKLQTEANNAVNKKRPDVSGLLAANSGGGSPTMLTGPQGVSSPLGLGSTTLLGS